MHAIKTKTAMEKTDSDSSSPVRILVVDDEPDVREVISDIVESFGYEASSASGGEEALSMVNRERFDLVVTDIQMPGISGIDLIERIHRSRPEIDLIAVTGFNMEYSYTDVIRLGASDFITKPLNVNEFQAKIHRVLRERRMRADLERLTFRDELTDLCNRRYFNLKGLEEVARAHRQEYPLFLILIDIDHFKKYNDHFGHQAGDRILKQLAEVIHISVRNDVDSSFRYGGDEFGVLVPQVSCIQAQCVAERLRRKYLELVDREDTSLSLGVAESMDTGLGPESDLRVLIQHADKALYESKRGGGNRVTLYSGDKAD